MKTSSVILVAAMAAGAAVEAEDTLASAGFEEFKIDKSAMGDAYWRIWNTEEDARIDADIEANRKTDGTFALPVSDGAEVEVEQIAHEFRFGANIFNFNQLGSKERNDRYKAMFGDGGLFNQATVPFYWREYEPSPGVVRSDGAFEDSERYWNSMTREEAKEGLPMEASGNRPDSRVLPRARGDDIRTCPHIWIAGGVSAMDMVSLLSAGGALCFS